MGKIVTRKGICKKVKPVGIDYMLSLPGAYWVRAMRVPYRLVPESKRVHMGKMEVKLVKQAIALWREDSEVVPDLKACDIRCAHPRLAGDQRYVMLRNSEFLLAVYRIKRDGVLKRLKLGKFPLSHLECGAYDDKPSVRPKQLKSSLG